MEVKETFDRILDLTGDLIETKKDVIIIKFVESSTKAASLTILGAISLVTAALILLFLGLGCAWWIGNYFGSITIGFFIVGGVFILLLLLLIALSKGTILPGIRNQIIRNLYENQDL